MNNEILSVESLLQLSYVRSKNWTSFLTNVMETKDDDEDACNIDELGHNISFEDKNENDSLSYMEEVEESEELTDTDENEVLKDITNVGNRNALLKPGKRYGNDALLNTDNNQSEENDANIQDILNQTTSVLVETGMDRALKTFNLEEIEEKVGGWLRRNNTLSFTNTRLAQKHLPFVTKKRHDRVVETISSDSESLNSGDTARYILSNRKRSTRSTLHTSMTIKKFRFVQSKRQALRQKYACLNIDEEFHCHRLHSKTRQHYNCISCVGLHSDHKHIRLCGNQRIGCKCLKNNISDSDTDTAVSIPSMECDRNKKQNVCCESLRGVQMDHTHKCICCRSHFSFPACCSINMRKSEKIRKRMCYPHPIKDLRPYLREGECGCRNEKKLCSLNKHLADTSTEDWLVENCDTPKKTVKTPSVHTTDRSVKCKSGKTLRKRKNKMNLELSNELFKHKYKSVSGNKPNSPKIKPMSTKKTVLKNKKDLMDGSHELNLALKLSKQTYKEGQKKQKQIAKDDLKKKKKTNMKLDQNLPIENDFNKGSQSSLFLLPGSSQNLCPESKRHLQNIEDSFFTNIKRSCNSTTMETLKQKPNSNKYKGMEAINKPLARKCSANKSSYCETLSSIIGNDECEIVTSTSDQFYQARKVQPNANLSRSLPRTRILLYNPDNPSSVPENSVAGSYFTVTEEHLCSIIGEKIAKNFFKYYIGPRIFDINSTIYYVPPQHSDVNTFCDTDSENDLIECHALFGQLQELKARKE